MVKQNVTVTINGTSHSHEVEARLLLVHFIRELAGLTGTQVEPLRRFAPRIPERHRQLNRPPSRRRRFSEVESRR